VSGKAVLYAQFARVGKALSNPVRLQLLELLAQGERSVDELAAAAGMRVGNTSAQLKVLVSAGLLIGRRSGSWVFYRIADDEVGAFVERMKDLARARLAAADDAAHAYLGDVAALEPVGIDELSRRVDAGEVVVLDVRPPAEYAAGHIPGALNIPLDRLADRLADLPADAEVVAYCRGRYCVMAPEAARLLRTHGYAARPLDGGLPEWRRTGLPVVADAASA
jgi:rhodanese-related sulfurtransferase